jgi:sodium/potassium/calcium exchanger 6
MKLKKLFKKQDSDDLQGCSQIFWTIIDWPLNFLRDLTIPAGDREKWDRTKMAIVPALLPMSCLYLYGLVEDTESTLFWVGLFATIPGIVFGLYIGFCTKKTNPPEWLMSLSAIMCFVMSIGWINFTSACVVDTISLAGGIIDLPKALLNMTVLAWGNCLGDMSADVAMTKKGFGEMAITATMAGPIFNIMMGGFLSNFCWLIKN